MRKEIWLYLVVIFIGIIILIFWKHIYQNLLTFLSYYLFISIGYGIIVLSLCPFYFLYHVRKESPPADPHFLYSFGPFPYLVIDSFGQILFFYTSIAVLFRLLTNPINQLIPVLEKTVLSIAFIILIYWSVAHTTKKVFKTFRSEATANIR